MSLNISKLVPIIIHESNGRVLHYTNIVFNAEGEALNYSKKDNPLDKFKSDKLSDCGIVLCKYNYPNKEYHYA